MTRWAVTSLTMFGFGLGAGILVSMQVTPTTKQQPTMQVPAAAKAAPVAQVSSPTPKSSPVIRVALTQPPLQPAPPTRETARPAEEVVIIQSVVPDRAAVEPVTPSAAPEPTRHQGSERMESAAIRMTEPGYEPSSLRSNPVVVRELARDIQRELYRAGCHSIIISGKWDPRTIKAAAEFSSNQNALLPMDKPDVVLLNLLRSYTGGGCGNQCAKSSKSAHGCAIRGLIANRSPLADGALVTVQPATVTRPNVTAPQDASAAATSRSTVQKPARDRSTARRRTTQTTNASSPNKKQLSWRRNVHYGIGSN